MSIHQPVIHPTVLLGIGPPDGSPHSRLKTTILYGPPALNVTVTLTDKHTHTFDRLDGTGIYVELWETYADDITTFQVAWASEEGDTFEQTWELDTSTPEGAIGRVRAASPVRVTTAA